MKFNTTGIWLKYEVRKNTIFIQQTLLNHFLVHIYVQFRKIKFYKIFKIYIIFFVNIYLINNLIRYIVKLNGYKIILYIKINTKMNRIQWNNKKKFKVNFPLLKYIIEKIKLK